MSQQHWQQVYQSKASNTVSWYQQRPDLSLQFILQTEQPLSAAIIDVGSGASVLLDHLIAAGYNNLTALDISQAALDVSKKRLASQPNSDKVTWLVGDITQIKPGSGFDIWHDRAVFHFLTEAGQRCAYVENLKASLQPGGFAVMATFAIGGPDKCSGLPIVQYDAASMQQQLGNSFVLKNSQIESHITPWQSEQLFCYSLFQFLG